MEAPARVTLFAYAGRLLLTLALLTLLGAWMTQLTDGSFLGLSQQHLYNDAMALALLGIGSLLDSICHAKGI